MIPHTENAPTFRETTPRCPSKGTLNNSSFAPLDAGSCADWSLGRRVHHRDNSPSINGVLPILGARSRDTDAASSPSRQLFPTSLKSPRRGPFRLRGGVRLPIPASTHFVNHCTELQACAGLGRVRSVWGWMAVGPHPLTRPAQSTSSATSFLSGGDLQRANLAIGGSEPYTWW